MKKIPTKVRDAIVKATCSKADTHGYMHSDRIQNGIFMENLVNSSEIGGRLAEYMNRSEIKTYIKDGILNRYAKDKTASELTTDITELVRKTYGQESRLIEGGTGKNCRLSLHRLENGDLLIVTGGTLLKWETALRKALDFIAKAPKLPPKNGKLNTLIILATSGRRLTEGDTKLLEKALDFIGVKVALV